MMKEKLKHLIEKSGKNQNQICKETGIDPALMSNWLKGNYKPSFKYLLILTDYFKVDIEYFAD